MVERCKGKYRGDRSRRGYDQVVCLVQRIWLGLTWRSRLTESGLCQDALHRARSIVSGLACVMVSVNARCRYCCDCADQTPLWWRTGAGFLGSVTLNAHAVLTRPLIVYVTGLLRRRESQLDSSSAVKRLPVGPDRNQLLHTRSRGSGTQVDAALQCDHVAVPG